MLSFFKLMAPTSSLFLYSTNVFIKYVIQERYRDGKHYVWCSEYFDPTKHGSYGGAYGIPASSSPAGLYLRYKQDRGDTHSYLINEQKAGIKKRAIDWFQEGQITQADLEDIIFTVDKNREDDWRPIIYVIHRGLVEPRLKQVPAKKSAGTGLEYIIEDLARHEFDMIEV